MAKKPLPPDAPSGSGAAPVETTATGAPPADPFAHVNDAHWGQGGRYIVVDGQRVPAPATDTTEVDHA